MFLFLKRNSIILTLALIIALITGFYVAGKQKASFHTTVFTTIGNASSSSSQENEQASTYFGETLMGWFRNPVFLDKIYTEAGITGNLSAHKQERQNLILEIDAENKENNTKLAEASLKVLESEIASFNQKTQNKFTLMNLGTTTYENPLKKSVLILAIVAMLGLIIVFGIFSLEALRGVISLPTQIESIFGQKNTMSLNLTKKEDLEYLATLCLKAKKTIIFAGVDFDHSNLTIQTVLNAGEIKQDLIHTILPQNFPILTLEDFELFLFVKPGKSKIKTLEQINALQIKEIKIFVI